MINTQIETFQRQLLELINGVPIPVSVKKIIVENAYLKLINATEQACKEELNNVNKEREEKSESKKHTD